MKIAGSCSFRRSAIVTLAAALILSLSIIAGRRTSSADADSGTLQLVDPVPALLNGPAITTDVNVLATNGTPVQGIGADGVSQIVLIAAAASAGEQFTFEVFNDQGQQSTSIDNDGALGAVGGASVNQSQITVDSVTTSQGPLAFAIYRAPIDFPRPGGMDANSSQRAVSIHWQIAGTPAGSASVTIIRPPVVLVHGLWGSPSDWNDFNPMLSDPRFAITRADFSFRIGSEISTSVPSYDITYEADANSLGYAYNAGQVAMQIESSIGTFKGGANPISMPVAAVQADIIGHSMGGDITRTMPLLETFASDTTYGRGNVHKLVTIDTPHLGSPLATQLLRDANECVRDTFATAGLYTFFSVTLAEVNITLSGAIGDLSGDGTGAVLSDALEALQPGSTVPIFTPQIPTTYIAGAMSTAQLDGLNNPPYLVIIIQDTCSDDPLANDLTVAGWPTVLSSQSDAIFPLTSQVNNATGITAAAAIHSPGTEKLGFLAPSALDAATPNPNRTIDLLNTPVTDPTYTTLR